MRRRKHTTTTLEVRLHALRSGRVSFTEFSRETAADWLRIARYVLGRWQVPDAVEVIDVEQELIIAAWRACLEWDPSRGVAIDVHVRWRAITAAKKWLHRQRGALRLDDRSPSRHPVSFTALGMDRGGMDDRSSMAEQVEEVARLRLLGSTLDKLAPQDAACVLALVVASGDVAEAARLVNGNTKLKLRLRLGSEHDARRAICRALEQVARHGAA